jgi:diguanylate cyclase (GGDEF)-like protein/PAS domain S-box-containing protein
LGRSAIPQHPTAGKEPVVSNGSELLVEVVTDSIAHILNAVSLREALPGALEMIATVARIDRVVVMENVSTALGMAPSVFFVWTSDDAPQVDAAAIISKSQARYAMEDLLRPLHKGMAVVIERRIATGPMRELLTQLQVVSTLQVPIMLHGAYCGQLIFDDCRGEREWTALQINILKLVAEFIGTVLTRERTREEVHYRDALLAAVNASVVDIMTAPDVNMAITTALGQVSTAVHVDRTLVIELVQTAAGASQVTVRNSWVASGSAAEVATIMELMSKLPDPEIELWTAPLRQGRHVRARLSELTASHRRAFEVMKVKSALLVPIMINGKYWGHISFDDCSHERNWTETEVDILNTLAQLIGTAIARERYVEELAKANTIVQNSPTILYRLRGNPSFPMIYISHNVSLLGHNREDWLRSPTLYQSFIALEDRVKVQGTLVELLETDAERATIEFRVLSSTGESRWMENRYTPVRDGDGRLVEIEGIMIDITERKLAADRIALLARTDGLTGLANRATFNDRLRQMFAASQRGANAFAVLYLDLDRFKDVNDMLGHPVGDKLLQAVAQRLKSATRANDLVVRLGGDEFVILQADVTEPAIAGALAAKVITAISAPYDIDGDQLRIGASCGISVFSSAADGPDGLLVQADQALYRSKEEGRGQFRFHSMELDLAAREYVALAEDLRNALERDEMELYYQSQFDLSSGRIVGVEALVRWNHPTRGQLLPELFVTVAEKSNMIQVLGRWVLDRACRQLAHWRKASMDVPLIAIKISVGQIKAGDEFVRDVEASLSRYGLASGDLELDVTEAALARTTLAQSSVLEELRRMGVCIAIDDFGAQYSSLDYLRTYRVARLKIARHMVAGAVDQGGGQAMIRAIVALAGELGVEVVAEGVETEEQRAALVNISSKTKGQGFYFGRPMSAEDTTQSLRLSLGDAGKQ